MAEVIKETTDTKLCAWCNVERPRTAFNLECSATKVGTVYTYSCRRADAKPDCLSPKTRRNKERREKWDRQSGDGERRRKRRANRYAPYKARMKKQTDAGCEDFIAAAFDKKFAKTEYTFDDLKIAPQQFRDNHRRYLGYDGEDFRMEFGTYHWRRGPPQSDGESSDEETTLVPSDFEFFSEDEEELAREKAEKKKASNELMDKMFTIYCEADKKRNKP